MRPVSTIWHAHICCIVYFGLTQKSKTQQQVLRAEFWIWVGWVVVLPIFMYRSLLLTVWVLFHCGLVCEPQVRADLISDPVSHLTMPDTHTHTHTQWIAVERTDTVTWGNNNVDDSREEETCPFIEITDCHIEWITFLFSWQTYKSLPLQLDFFFLQDSISIKTDFYFYTHTFICPYCPHVAASFSCPLVFKLKKWVTDSIYSMETKENHTAWKISNSELERQVWVKSEMKMQYDNRNGLR